MPFDRDHQRKPDGAGRAVPKLTAASVKKAPPGRHVDGDGLCLVVDPSGARRWVLRTVVHGRRRDIGLGGVSWVSLAEAREEAARMRKIARAGGDPLAERAAERHRGMTFEEAARETHTQIVVGSSRNGKHLDQWIRSLEVYAFPTMGDRPVSDIGQADVLRALTPIWTEKAQTAKRVRKRMGSVFGWARTAGHRSDANPVDGVEMGLPRQRDRQEHHKATPWGEAPAFWSVLSSMDGMGAIALRFVILTAARSGEARGATWSEIDLEARVWTIPAERMKGGREHRVPLSDTAVALLRRVLPLRTGSDSLVFPSRRRDRPLSDMTLAAVLKRLGVDATVHGFRSTFRDWAEETTAYSYEAKELALAHNVGSKTERAYRRSDHFDQRRGMMEDWAAYLTRDTALGARC